jgi:hypothetical protein
VTFGDTDATNIEDLAGLVNQGKVAPLVGRDTARCMAIESDADEDITVYTMSGESSPRHDRHIRMDATSPVAVRNVKRFLRNTECRFSQICLDYFYMPPGYLAERFNLKRLCGDQLKEFAATLLAPDGAIYFPFHSDVIQQLHDSRCSWESLYDAEIIHCDDISGMNKNLLWRGTQRIDEKTLHIFNKVKEQEETYCVTGRSIIPNLVGKSGLKTLLTSCRRDLAKYRFIELKLLQLPSPSSVS